jgi:hypothetical protein
LETVEFTMKKLLNPAPENREACLQQLWEKLNIQDRSESSLSGEFNWLVRDIEERSSAKASLSSCKIAKRYLTLAAIARRRGDQESSSRLLRQSFAFICWARELDVVARQDPTWPELEGDDLLMPMITWQALAPQCGSPWFALWLAPHLHNQFANPEPGMVVMYYSRDYPARRFMEVLQRSLITGVWPAQFDLAGLSAYGKLLQACEQPQAWEDALMAFCDWRIANAYGYPEMGASKRRRQSSLENVLDAERVEQVFPVELLTLKFAFERATGRTLSLDAPHPLLQGPLMALPFPAVEPVFEDEWTARLAALRHQLAPGLALRSPIVPKYL